MASALLHGDRSDVVSRGKKPPSPVVQGSKTPIPRSSEAKKRLNSSDGSSKQLVSAAKVPASGRKSATKQRPSDILNPKTADPVSKLSVLLGLSWLQFSVLSVRSNLVLCVQEFTGKS